MTEHDRLNPQDLDLWEYFSGLYKYSNKGIKGRGKDRRVSSPDKRSRSGGRNRSSNSGNQKNNSSSNAAAAAAANNNISVSSGCSDEASHLTPPGSDDGLRNVAAAPGGRSYDRISNTAGVMATLPPTTTTVPYLGTPSSENVDFHEQLYRQPHCHPHQRPQHHPLPPPLHQHYHLPKAAVQR